MDLEQRAHRQNLRVIISETIMVIAVALMVVILVLIVSGYWLNSDFKVERQGMLQISSVPTGASVAVDGDTSWFQRTNTSKILSSGEHEIILTKDGYDSWSKAVNISEGLLYKLNYPHLFLEERVRESVYDVATAAFATVSPNRKLLLLANNTTLWSLINLDSDTIKSTELNLSAVLSASSSQDPSDNQSSSSTTTPILFNGTIISAEWDSANEHVLLEISLDSKTEWLLIDIRNVAKSVNLTRKFTQDFSSIRIFDNSASTLLALVNSDLYKIDVDGLQISPVLASGINSYDFYDSEIVLASKDSVSLLKNFAATPSEITTVDSLAQVLFGRFYENKYIFIITGGTIAIYNKDDLIENQSYQINFTPATAKVGPEGEFIFMSEGSHFATLDMEAQKVVEWSIDTTHFGWLNGHMLYAIDGGVLSVYDFDGLNHRTLASNVSERFPVTITNDKWLYYFSDGQLIREWLVAK